jgi:hypothetical protein
VGDCDTQRSFISGQWWDQYLSNPQTPLFQRGYDAIGFYAHMQESGISPFERLPAMLTAGSDASAFTAAQVDDRFLETWAGGYARQQAWDPSLWETTGPGITATAPAASSTALNNGASVTDDINAYSNDIGACALTADIVTISVGFDGRGELHTADGTTLDGPALNGSFCTAAGGCALPPGCSYAGPDLGYLAAGDAELAVNGGVSGSRLTITGMSVADFCSSAQSTQPTPAPTTQPAASARTNCPVGYPVTGESDRQEPGLCVLGVQGNALVEVLAHPDAAQALYTMAMQNAGDTPTTCEQLSAGSPEPLLGSGARPPARADGAVGSLQCFYEPSYPQSHYKDGATVVWFSSASQADQALGQAEQFLQRSRDTSP